MYTVSPLIKYFVYQGVPMETVLLLLMLPIIVTLIALIRQVVGIKAFGIYTPAIVTVALLALKPLKYGIFLFAVVIILGMLLRFALKNLRILYLPRVAIMITIVAFAMLGVLLLGGHFSRTGLAAVNIFPILIMITIVEKFVTAQIEKGNKAAMFLAMETLIISVICFYVVDLKFLNVIVAAYPWVVLFTIPLNIFLGKWDGLRLVEYFRFREVLKRLN